MDWGIEDGRAERAVDAAAAATFAAAGGFAAWAVGFTVGPTIGFVAAALLIAYAGLRQVAAGERDYALAAFQLQTFEPRAEAQGEATGELILQDMLAKVSPHDRVVQLFGASQSRLDSNHQRPAPPDASQVLSNALAELRRSMR